MNVFENEMSPAGTTEPPEMPGTVTHEFFRPYGTRFPLARLPTVETVGYYRASLRDWGGVNAALRTHGDAR